MAVFRIEKTRDYTVMSNHHLRDKSLSLKAKGLLSLMLSLPEEWDYHRAFYSLDVGDGIETHAVSRVPSPEELWMRKLEKEQLREALEHLPPVQSRRIYAYFMLGMKMVGIARIEGVSRTSVSQSIRSSLKNLKRYFKQTEME